jgi:hypothetical protein
MAASNITEASLTATLKEKLEATHVEIEDMSGTSQSPLPSFPSNPLSKLTFIRRLRPSLLRPHRLAPIHEENHPRPAPPRQQRAEGRDRGHPRLDTEVLYARGVDEAEGAEWRRGGSSAGEGDEWGGCDGDDGVRSGGGGYD